METTVEVPSLLLGNGECPRPFMISSQWGEIRVPAYCWQDWKSRLSTLLTQGIIDYVCPPKFMLEPNAECDGIKKWSLWEMLKL